MDAVKFLQERKRMFLSGDSSLICWMEDGMENSVDPEVLVRNVEQWSAAHPRKTRQSVFLEQWPQASIGDDGVLKVCPCPISESHRNAQGGCVDIHRQCSDCRKEFWGREVE